MLLDRERLQQARIAVGLSRHHLARELGIGHDLIADLEIGRNQERITLATLLAITHRLHLDVSDLFIDAPQPNRLIDRHAAALAGALSSLPEGATAEALCTALHLTTLELRNAYRHARRELRTHGLTISVDGTRHYRLRATRAYSLSAERAVHRSHITRLSHNAASVLHDIYTAAYDRNWSEHADPNVKAGVSELLAAGLIVRYRDRHRPSDTVVRSMQTPFWQSAEDVESAALDH